MWKLEEVCCPPAFPFPPEYLSIRHKYIKFITAALVRVLSVPNCIFKDYPHVFIAENCKEFALINTDECLATL